MGSYKWVMGRVTTLITHTRGLITPLRTTHEPPSSQDKAWDYPSGLCSFGGPRAADEAAWSFWGRGEGDRGFGDV